MPGEFRYWHNIRRRRIRIPRNLLKKIAKFDPFPSDEQVQHFAAAYYEGDVIAESFVEQVVDQIGYSAARTLLTKALESGVSSLDSPPPALVALVADVESAPVWLDWAKVELGAKVFRRFGSSVFEFAGAATLQSYAECSVAKALVLSGGYKGAQTRRRFLETSSFWIDVSEASGMRSGGSGLSSALAVRIMHVFVRRRIQKHENWNREEWGVPISQGDALLTLMGGSVAPGIAMKALGYRCSRTEIEAMMHFWRYVGHVMGVRPRWYPTTVPDGLRLLLANAIKGASMAGKDGEMLCRSFADAFEPPDELPVTEKIRAKWQQGIHLGYLRFFTPPGSFPSKFVPMAGVWALHPLVRFPFVFAAETLRRHFPSLEPLADKRARAQRNRWQKNMSGQFKTRFHPPKSA